MVAEIAMNFNLFPLFLGQGNDQISKLISNIDNFLLLRIENSEKKGTKLHFDNEYFKCTLRIKIKAIHTEHFRKIFSRINENLVLERKLIYQSLDQIISGTLAKS